MTSNYITQDANIKSESPLKTRYLSNQMDLTKIGMTALGWTRRGQDRHGCAIVCAGYIRLGQARQGQATSPMALEILSKNKLK